MITKVSDKNELKGVYHKIFNSYSPFDPLDKNSFSVRAVIFPTVGRFLSESQFQALSETLNAIEESSMIISEVETYPYDPFTKDRHWILSNPISYEEYISLPIAIENAIYSESNNWGLLLSHEDHAVLVCNDEFSNIFQNHYQNLQKDLEMFVNYWDDVKLQGVETDWLSDFINSLTVN